MDDFSLDVVFHLLSIIKNDLNINHKLEEKQLRMYTLRRNNSNLNEVFMQIICQKRKYYDESSLLLSMFIFTYLKVNWGNEIHFQRRHLMKDTFIDNHQKTLWFSRHCFFLFTWVLNNLCNNLKCYDLVMFFYW